MYERGQAQLSKDIREAMYHNNTHITFIRLGRRMGKTNLLMEWMVDYTANCLYYAQYPSMVRMMSDTIREKYKDRIVMSSQHLIVFKGGGGIRFASNLNDVRGCKFDKVAYDEAGKRRSIQGPRMNDDSLIDYFPEAKFLAASSVLEKDSFMDKMIEKYAGSDPTNFLYLQHSYLDAVARNIYDEEVVKECKMIYSPATFLEEFGPWDSPVTYTNEDFLHLLPNCD